MNFDVELPWPDFKAHIDSRGWAYQEFTISNTYYLFAKQNSFTALCKIYKDSGADQTEYEDDYQAGANQPIKDRVVTDFETDDKTLKLASVSGSIVDGECVLELKVPGTFTPGEYGRYISGGYAITDKYGWDDRITKVEIVDIDNILGYGAGAVVGAYHDDEVDAENRGWRFWRGAYNGTDCEGECDVEPIGGFGKIPAELYLRCTFEAGAGSPATKFCVNFWWAKKD